MAFKFKDIFSALASVGHHPFPMKPEQMLLGLWIFLVYLLCYTATDLTFLHIQAAITMFPKHHRLINSFKQNIEVGRKGSPSFSSNFLWQFSLKITRTVLFCQLSGNSMQDSFSFSPCSKETAPLEMFEHWCILVQLWEKGRFFPHVCVWPRHL